MLPQIHTACTRDYYIKLILFYCKHNKIFQHFNNFMKLYVGWNFNFGNTALDWIQALLE